MRKIRVVYPWYNLLNRVFLNSMFHISQQKSVVFTLSDCETTGGRKKKKDLSVQKKSLDNRQLCKFGNFLELQFELKMEFFMTVIFIC